MKNENIFLSNLKKYENNESVVIDKS